MKKEAEIEGAAIRRLYDRIGCMQLKMSEPLRHFPDRLILLPDARAVFVEFKRPNQKLRFSQNFVKAQLEKLGFEVYVVDNEDEYVELLTRL